MTIEEAKYCLLEAINCRTCKYNKEMSIWCRIEAKRIINEVLEKAIQEEKEKNR